MREGKEMRSRSICAANIRPRLLGIVAVSYVLSFLLVSWELSAFVLISNGGKVARWANGRAEYYIKDIPAEFESAIESSFSAWADISGIDLRFTAKGVGSAGQSRDGKNTLQWVTDNWTSLSFRPPSNALAVTLSSFNGESGLVIDADIYFNAVEFGWANVEGPEDEGFVDVENIATHEIGHMIGLDHSSVNYYENDPELAEATMFYASGSGETSRREPKADDIRGVTALYSATPMSKPSINAVTEIDRAGRTILYRVTGSHFSEFTSFILASENFSMGDIVSRYKTILSSTEAEVEFNVSGFYDATPKFLALNDTGGVASMDFQLDQALLDSAGFNSSSGSDGGGCVATHRASTSVDLFWMLGFLFVLVKILTRQRTLLRIKTSRFQRPD